MSEPGVPSGGGPPETLDLDPEEAAALERLVGAAPGPGAAELSVPELEALLFVAERPLTPARDRRPGRASTPRPWTRGWATSR